MREAPGTNVPAKQLIDALPVRALPYMVLCSYLSYRQCPLKPLRLAIAKPLSRTYVVVRWRLLSSSGVDENRALDIKSAWLFVKDTFTPHRHQEVLAQSKGTSKEFWYSRVPHGTRLPSRRVDAQMTRPLGWLWTTVTCAAALPLELAK